MYSVFSALQSYETTMQDCEISDSPPTAFGGLRHGASGLLVGSLLLSAILNRPDPGKQRITSPSPSSQESQEPTTQPLQLLIRARRCAASNRQEH
ncbi:hypothetical protein PISL3812_06475 [Talaromyces islandicus]|uniref:Uncharacterized protein n=1 Tax=Talaromyces islandicus TaxID=28573 RepID=A0A0U1M1P6_TALIS|nr:hypothetical protein PISL3812_06475 [Talaromyces islandicus]